MEVHRDIPGDLFNRLADLGLDGGITWQRCLEVRRSSRRLAGPAKRKAAKRDQGKPGNVLFNTGE